MATGVNPTTLRPWEQDKKIEQALEEKRRVMDDQRQADFLKAIEEPAMQNMVGMVTRLLGDRIDVLVAEDAEASAYLKILKAMEAKTVSGYQAALRLSNRITRKEDTLKP